MLKSIHRPHHKVVCAHLRAIREAAGLTQSQLAKQFQNTQAWVSSVEVGITRLDTVQVWEWCKACGTTLTAFSSAVEDELATLRTKATTSAARARNAPK